MSEPRAYTADEVRDAIIAYARMTASYWAGLPSADMVTGKTLTTQERCDGVAFSILSMLDGCSAYIPAITLKLDPHEDDKDLLRSEGENWFEPGMEISFALHEYYHAKEQKS